ncbi:hypothetical protein [Chitinophaga niabensis]|uniref:Uncharacterized protein n=1 Tax=Chitinophaga niabensis TaxID=536979 RepID=A0A1N6K4X0_9BACT|nr:hypothetical protein [Chitinophaga niabensis]SIO51387.1 hypothetical protein SAMN04488055_5048 [Chitinophaga niabensis]
MKKSNKLLIVLCCFIIITLVFFNMLLNVQLKAGNFRNDFKDIPPVVVTLQPFNHVVYDGRLYMSHSRTSQSWTDRSMYLSIGEKEKYKLEMPSNITSLLKYSYQGDTLFISFNEKGEKIGRRDYVPESGVPLHLFAPGLTSVSSLSGAIIFSGIDQKGPLALHLSQSMNFTLHSLHLPILNLHIDTNAQVRIIDNSYVDSLALTMSKNTVLTINTPDNIKSLQPVQLDASARISMEGKANDMKTYLQKTQ